MKIKSLTLLALVVVFAACSGNKDLNTRWSNTTGWNYYDEQTTNFEAQEGIAPGTPIGMVPIQGGSFTIGEKDEFVTAPRNNAHRSITVSSFYMDKYEITNMNWREYLHWMEVVFQATAKHLALKARPDTTVWWEEMAYNDPYVENYFRHPAFSYYPVVGVSWSQAMDYCRWRTDRVNELALINVGEIAVPPFQELLPTSDEAYKDEWESSNPGYYMDEFEDVDPLNPDESTTMYRPSYEWIRDKFVFNTEKYLSVGDYQPELGKHPRLDYAGNVRKIDRADGILVVGYRLPTESEWEFAAFSPVAGEDGLTIEGKIYPWSGYRPRNLTPAQQGLMQANFVRGRGDMMGVSGALNDGYVITAPVDAYYPNDFGLYNMAGNVNEWVFDVYRETTNQETSEYNSFRGNVFFKVKKNAEGFFELDSLGRCEIEPYDSLADVRNWKDGDKTAVVETDYPLDSTGIENLEDMKLDPSDMLAPRINNRTRVYKGGSWKDRVYWLSPATRRYADQDSSANTIGFRCAMSTVGHQIDTFTGRATK